MPHTRTSTLSISPNGHRRLRAQDGASAVEFAILTPLVFMIVFGMFSGGLAWNSKQALSHATREAARYGATLPIGELGSCTAASCAWLDQVHQRVLDEATAELSLAANDPYICVAYVESNTASGNNRRKTTGTLMTQPTLDRCFEDTRPEGEPRVQVLAARRFLFQAVLVNPSIVIQSGAAARYEVPSFVAPSPSPTPTVSS